MEECGVPRWKEFCDKVMVRAEVIILHLIDEFRTDLDKASRDMPIHCWHFAHTQDSRNYMVYNMMDTVFGFARHGEKMVVVVEDPRFKELLKFVVEEEHECFIKAEDKGEYFSSLASRMLRLSGLVDGLRSENEAETVRDGKIPDDPVDVLFEYYGDGEQRPEQPSVDDTLKVLLERMERAKEDNASNDKPDLTAIHAQKEGYEPLKRFEKRLEKVALSVKAITQQMLQNPEEGECHVVRLFGRDIFFICPPPSKAIVAEFLCLQRNLSQKYAKYRADALTCFRCSDFVPLVKGATCMPDSLLARIEECCKLYGQRDEQDDSTAEDKGEGAMESEKADKPTATVESGEGEETSCKDEAAKTETQTISTEQPGKSKSEVILESVEPPSKSPEKDQPGDEATEPAGKGDPSDPESDKAKPEGTGDPSEKKPSSALDSIPGDTEAALKRIEISPTALESKLPAQMEKYYAGLTGLGGAIVHCTGRCIFSVKDQDRVDYFSPVLGYLPLLPIMEVLCTKEGLDVHVPVHAEDKQ